MNTYDVQCFRPPGATGPVRSVVFPVDADTLEQAEEIASARLIRMKSLPGPAELEIDNAYQVAL